MHDESKTIYLHCLWQAICFSFNYKPLFFQGFISWSWFAFNLKKAQKNLSPPKVNKHTWLFLISNTSSLLMVLKTCFQLRILHQTNESSITCVTHMHTTIKAAKAVQKMRIRYSRGRFQKKVSLWPSWREAVFFLPSESTLLRLINATCYHHFGDVGFNTRWLPWIAWDLSLGAIKKTSWISERVSVCVWWRKEWTHMKLWDGQTGGEWVLRGVLHNVSWLKRTGNYLFEKHRF